MFGVSANARRLAHDGCFFAGSMYRESHDRMFSGNERLAHLPQEDEVELGLQLSELR